MTHAVNVMSNTYRKKGMSRITKQDFKDFLTLSENIKEMEDQLFEIDTSLQKMTQTLNDMPTGQRENDKLTDRIADKIELRNLIDERVAEKWRKQIRIEKAFAMLNETDERLMRLRYCKEMSFEMISVEMNYCYRHTTRKHGQILEYIHKNG